MASGFSTLVLLVPVLSLLAGGPPFDTVSAIQQDANARQNGTAQDSVHQPEQNPPDRTTPLLDRMTAEQKEHARVHQGRLRRYTRNILNERLVLNIVEDVFNPPAPRPAARVFRDLACTSDAALLGRVQSETVLPTENGALTFTDYKVEVAEALRSPSSAKVASGQAVTVTKVGGLLEIEGLKTGVEMTRLPSLQVGDYYLFFVQYLPSSHYKGIYNIRSPEGLFRLVGDRFVGNEATPTTDIPLSDPGIQKEAVLQWLRGLSCK